MTDDQLSMFEDGPAGGKHGKAASIAMSRTINGKVQNVFDHWLIPVFIENWIFSTDDSSTHILKMENTVRRGGTFFYSVKAGSKEKTYGGEYRKLDIPNLLEFSWISSEHPKAESILTVRFEAVGDKTRLKLSAKLHPALAHLQEAEKSEWSARLDRLVSQFKP